MIGNLPKKLTVGGKDYEIRSDYRCVLNIYAAFDDNELDEYEKALI